MIERSTSPSRLHPGWLDVIITGDTPEEVQGEIFNMEFDEGYTQLSFTLPVRASDQRWIVKGRVWRDPEEREEANDHIEVQHKRM